MTGCEDPTRVSSVALVMTRKEETLTPSSYTTLLEQLILPHSTAMPKLFSNFLPIYTFRKSETRTTVLDNVLMTVSQNRDADVLTEVS